MKIENTMFTHRTDSVSQEGKRVYICTYDFILSGIERKEETIVIRAASIEDAIEKITSEITNKYQGKVELLNMQAKEMN